MKSKEYLEAKETIIAKATAVFTDTYEEFSSITAIKNKFSDWKFNRGSSYKTAFISLSMPLLFSPFVRLELLKWDPLVDSSFEQMVWYNELFTYGIDKNSSKVDPDDEDPNLIPNLIGKVLLPKAVKIISNIWNPCSPLQAQKAYDLVQRLLDYLEPQSDAMKELFTSILVSMRATIETLPSEITENIFDSIIFLLQNITSWDGVLSTEIVQSLLVDNLMNSRVIPYVNLITSQDKALDALEKIVQVFPSTWFEGGTAPDKLMLFRHFVGTFAKKLSTIQRVERVTKLLKGLNDWESIKKLGKRVNT